MPVKTKFNYFIFFIAFTLTCQPKAPDGNLYFSEGDLPKAIELKGLKYSIPEIVNPKGIFLKDDLAIVFEVKNVVDEKFHIINLRTGSYQQSKGIDGLGPGEITVISQIENSSEENKIWTFDPEQRIFSKFDLVDSLKIAEEQFKAPETAYYLTDAAWTSDSTLIGNTVDGYTKYLHLTRSGGTLALFGDWRDMVKGKELPNGIQAEDMDANLISSIFQGPIKVSEDKKHLIKVGMSVDYIDIVDLVNQKITTIYGPTQEIQDFEMTYMGGYQMPVFSSTSTTRYADAYAGKDSFFVLFRGKPYKELSNPDNLNKIFELDYSGNIRNQYQLDYPLFGFAVDEKNRAIYGVTVDREPNLVRFDY